MITVTYILTSLLLIYLLWRVNRTPTKGIILIGKLLLFIVVSGQFWSIFQFGTKTAGVPSKILLYEDFFIKYLDLPNLGMEWLSCGLFIITLIFCSPKRAE